MTGPVRVLMVCLGNICRSPTAEAVFRAQVAAAGLADWISVDSAGTSDWHVGEAPDARSIRHGARRSYDLAPLRARQVGEEDFTHFDYIMAMDEQNLRDLRRRCAPGLQHKLVLFLDHPGASRREVPDPYDHGAEAFELVLDLIESASAAWLDHLRRQHALPPA